MSTKQLPASAAATLFAPQHIDDNAGPPPIGALTIAGFAKLYNVGRTHVYEEIKSGRLTARKTGARTIILRSEADRWARSLPLVGVSR